MWYARLESLEHKLVQNLSLSLLLPFSLFLNKSEQVLSERQALTKTERKREA